MRTGPRIHHGRWKQNVRTTPKTIACLRVETCYVCITRRPANVYVSVNQCKFFQTQKRKKAIYQTVKEDTRNGAQTKYVKQRSVWHSKQSLDWEQKIEERIWRQRCWSTETSEHKSNGNPNLKNRQLSFIAYIGQCCVSHSKPVVLTSLSWNGQKQSN